MRQTPEMIEVNNRKAEEVLRRVEEALDEKDAHLIRAVFESYSRVVHLVEDKNTSIRRLRHLFFGSRTEKTADVVARNASAEETSKLQSTTPSREEGANGSAVIDSSTEGEAENQPPTAPGHGRNGADPYQGATRVKVSQPTLTAGDPCPACQEGTVYEKPAGVFVRFIGNPPLSATIYDLQKLRCGLCGKVFSAPLPQEVGNSKYDASAGIIIVLLKYGTGFPFNRLAGTQGHLAIPLPASTQWDIVNALATSLAPIFTELIQQAAQGPGRTRVKSFGK